MQLKINSLGKRTQKISLNITGDNLRVWDGVEKVVKVYPNIASIDVKTGQILAVGESSYKETTPIEGQIEFIKPFSAGVVANLKPAYELLTEVFAPYLSKWSLVRPNLICSLPVSASPVDREVLLNLLSKFSFGRIYLVDTTLAAGIGAGIPVSATGGNGIANIESDLLQGSLISLATIVSSVDDFFGVDQVKEGISIYLVNSESIELPVGKLDQLLQYAFMQPKSERLRYLEVTGRNSVFGYPETKKIDCTALHQHLEPMRARFSDKVKELVSKTPPQLSSDIIEKGVLLTGSVNELQGLAKYLTHETSVPVHTPEEPELCVVQGLSYILENVDLWKRSVMSK
jgi:rod shape-determining protein MreB and related proteins